MQNTHRAPPRGGGSGLPRDLPAHFNAEFHNTSSYSGFKQLCSESWCAKFSLTYFIFHMFYVVFYRLGFLCTVCWVWFVYLCCVCSLCVVFECVCGLYVFVVCKYAWSICIDVCTYMVCVCVHDSLFVFFVLSIEYFSIWKTYLLLVILLHYFVDTKITYFLFNIFYK